MKQNKSKWIALIIVLVAPLLSVIDVFIINIAIPAIRVGVHASEAQVQLVIAGYLLGYASFLITGGRFGDHFGRKKVFVWGMVFFTAISCWCGLSHSATELNIARFLQGVSASFMVPQTISYIQVFFTDPHDRARALGWFGFTLGVASILGQLLGGLLTSFHFFIPGWRLIFFINLPFGAAAIIAAIYWLQETPRDTSGRFDFTGVFVLTAALLALIIPLVEGREHGWPWWSWATLLLSLILFVWFIADQRKKKAQQQFPLIDVDLFRFKDFNIGLICVTCFFVVHNSYLLTSTLLLQNGYHVTSFLAGKIYALFGLGAMISSLFSIRLIKRYGKKVLQFGVLIVFICLGLQLLVFSTANISLPLFCAIIWLHGFGIGCVLPTIMNITLQSIPNHFAGAASGVYSTAQQASSALGISIIGGFFFSVLSNRFDFIHYHDAFQYSTIVNMVVLLVMGLLLFILPGGATTEVHISE